MKDFREIKKSTVEDVKESKQTVARMNLKKAIEEAIDSGLRYVDLIKACTEAYGMKSTD